MLARVKAGETIVIMDRQQPVARLVPVAEPHSGSMPSLSHLVKRGLVSPARGQLDCRAFRAQPMPDPGEEGDVLAALLAERDEGR